MVVVNIYEAKTSLSKLVELTLEGEEVVIAKHGRPLVRMSPVEGKAAKQPTVGFMAGQFEIPEDFDTMMLDEIAALFEGDGQ